MKNLTFVAVVCWDIISPHSNIIQMWYHIRTYKLKGVHARKTSSFSFVIVVDKELTGAGTHSNQRVWMSSCPFQFLCLGFFHAPRSLRRKPERRHDCVLMVGQDRWTARHEYIRSWPQRNAPFPVFRSKSSETFVSGFQIPGLFCDFLLVSLGSVLKGSGKYTAFSVISIEQVPVFLHQFSHFRAVSISR